MFLSYLPVTEDKLGTRQPGGLLANLWTEPKTLNNGQHGCDGEGAGAFLHVAVKDASMATPQHRVHLTYNTMVPN
jgi:hypothetical protein